ncbi:MAG TPA: mechanosensitive ion channel domain-containing protein [Gaiellaceae bacterium]|nr:mechanosensitive ion channel domain-containing protein [Gaiellaceae bacterium]
MGPWARLIVVCAVIAGAAVLAKLVDMRMARRELPPQAETRYRVLRRSLMGAIIFVGVLSALLIIPQVRAVATGLLASSAVIGLVVGLAAQRTLSNFVAGVMIGLSQPIRLGDRVTIAEGQGVVEEIGLVYTRIRQDDRSRLVVPNDRLAADTIKNATIVDRERLAEITVPVPRDKDLQAVIDLLREKAEPTELLVTGLDADAVVTLRAWADDEASARRLESELRVRVQQALRQAGVYEAA